MSGNALPTNHVLKYPRECTGLMEVGAQACVVSQTMALYHLTKSKALSKKDAFHSSSGETVKWRSEDVLMYLRSVLFPSPRWHTVPTKPGHRHASDRVPLRKLVVDHQFPISLDCFSGCLRNCILRMLTGIQVYFL